jgi:uncharacterized protein (TIGR03435 family)
VDESAYRTLEYGMLSEASWPSEFVRIQERNAKCVGKPPDDVFEEWQKMPLEERVKQNRMMEQSLLADRFKLKMHFETREMSVYELTVAKGGAKVKPAVDPGPTPPPLAPGSAAPGPPSGLPDPSKMRQGLMALSKGNGMEVTVRGMTLQQVFQGPFMGLGGAACDR